jgi:D-methionine transport system substrate-binding protein
MKKHIFIILASFLIASLLFVGCTSKPNETSSSANEKQTVTLKVGASPVPHAEILNLIKPILKEQGIELKIIEFTDYVNPNLALADKELDANFFQHAPYLESFVREHNVDLISACKVHVEPLGLYSKKVKSIDTLKKGATIAIPNDPTNEGRALILLDTKGIIKLDPNAGLEATEKDIIQNPKNLIFKPIDAAQLPRTLDDVDASIINTNYALEAGLSPDKDALLMEGSDSPYPNVLAIRSEDKDNQNIKKLVSTLQSEKVKSFIEEKYKGAMIPAF